jgi:phage major head subunit gpT-like protein
VGFFIAHKAIFHEAIMGLDVAQKTAKLRGLTALFDQTAQAAKPFYPTLCMVMNSLGADEQYGMLGSIPAVREWAGERHFNQLAAADFTIKNRKWEDSILIEKDNIDDDRLGIYGPVLQNLANEATHHPDKLLMQLIVAGASTVCFDGQYFFDTDHSWGKSGTQSNALTYDASDHTKVTGAEFRAAYHLALVAMMNFKRDNGEPFVRPIVEEYNNLLVMVPPALKVAATEGTKAAILGNNSNIVIGDARVVASPYMTNTAKWHLYDLSQPIKPYVFQARKPLTRQMKGMDDAEFKDVKFMCDARYNVGYGAWWTAVETTFN